MGPANEIARLITEDPDIFNEAADNLVVKKLKNLPKIVKLARPTRMVFKDHQKARALLPIYFVFLDEELVLATCDQYLDKGTAVDVRGREHPVKRLEARYPGLTAKLKAARKGGLTEG